ncbi:MAG: hypothetical protein KJ879_01995 [Nanoarchaeota archaeon]|nr:hypothetical protein [Nanoarchaeota archaeon]
MSNQDEKQDWEIAFLPMSNPNPKTEEYLKKRLELHKELVKVGKKILAYKPKKKSKKKPKLADFEVVLPHEDETYFL